MSNVLGGESNFRVGESTVRGGESEVCSITVEYRSVTVGVGGLLSVTTGGFLSDTVCGGAGRENRSSGRYAYRWSFA